MICCVGRRLMGNYLKGMSPDFRLPMGRFRLLWRECRRSGDIIVLSGCRSRCKCYKELSVENVFRLIRII